MKKRKRITHVQFEMLCKLHKWCLEVEKNNPIFGNIYFAANDSAETYKQYLIAKALVKKKLMLYSDYWNDEDQDDYGIYWMTPKGRHFMELWEALRVDNANI